MPSKFQDHSRPPAPNLKELLRSIERGWFLKTSAYGCLRRMPEQTWRTLIDSLPICVCGKLISPHDAVRKKRHCSPRCVRRAAQRRHDLKKKIEREAQREREAIAESLYQ